MTWRDSVYNGTLAPVLENTSALCTGQQLDDLLSTLAHRSSSFNVSSLSDLHSVNRIDIGLYLGDRYVAKDKRWLVQNGFTHVVNCAEGAHEYQVNTGPHFYSGTSIKYMGIPGHDRPSWNIGVYFEDAARFINRAVSSGGKVLVHCVVGISRSATIVIAYIMIFKRMRALEALKYVFARRRVYPNMGFMLHLAHLNNMLFNRYSTAATTMRNLSTRQTFV